MGQNIYKYSLEGLDCSKCALKIEKSLKDHDFRSVHVNFTTQTLSLDSSDVDRIIDVVSKIEPNLHVIPIVGTKFTPPQTFSSWLPIFQICISLVLLIVGIIFTQSFSVIQIAFFGYICLFTAYFIAGWKVLWKAVCQLRNFDFTNEHFLMSIATLGAIVIQEIPEAVAVMLFYTVGEFLQTKAVNRSRGSISSLLDIRPDEAHLIQDDTVKTVPASSISTGDIILVKPGERVPLDGEVVKGQTSLDMSTLTGESRPVTIKTGMEVISGSITNGSIQLRVTSPYHESTVTRILEAVENAAQNKSQTELFITRFSRNYTPLVIFIAILIAVVPPIILIEPFEEWMYRALVILVISCPCALVVSIPLVYFSGIGKSSREGILMKGAHVIDSLNDISAVLWDKTGTLTVGKFKVVTIVPTSGYNPQDVLSYAALAEAHSTHPIAVSIREAFRKPIDMTQIEEYEELPALGISMRTKSGDVIVVGNDKMAHQMNCPHSECVRDETAVYVIKNGEYIGHIIIDDQIKESSFSAIDNLKELNIPQIALLTGDTKMIAERVGNTLGIDQQNIYASLMPLNKLEILDTFVQTNSDEGGVVFVGDGINDAPVIAQADIGVAMGGIGSDATIEAADLVIMDDNPSKLSRAIVIAKRTNTIAKQNILLALGIKSIFILLGAVGIASMWAAVFGDVGVTIITVLNSLRLLK
ncbi:MAG: heavy metal translocating P-type ATPase [Candidatus Hodarchaeales archaeon]|jgi:Cd2+/Zn2+-exporting ATPase